MNKQEFLGVLTKVKPGLAKSSQIEQFTNFVFKDGWVTTYNDEISISHPVDTNIEGAVNAEKLYGIIEKLKKDEFELSVEGSEVKIKSGRTKAGISLQEDSDMPTVETPDDEDEWGDLPEDFTQALLFAMFSCSTDQAKPVLTCVHVNSENQLIESTDSYRLTRYYTSDDIPIESCLIPNKSAGQLAKYDVTQCSQTEGWAHFATNEGTIFSARTINGNFPEIDEFFNVKGTKVQLPKNTQEMLDRAGVFSKRKFFLDEYVVIELANKKMTVNAHADNGWFSETVNLGYKGEPITFATNPAFVSKMCEETRECEVGESSIKFSTEFWEHVIALTRK